MEKTNTELIVLQSAHVTQLTDNNTKTDWRVEANITNELIATLPKHLLESEVFTILEFARKYELVALNTGIEFQKGQNNKVLMNKINILENASKNFADENEKLASLLDTFIGEKE